MNIPREKNKEIYILLKSITKKGHRYLQIRNNTKNKEIKQKLLVTGEYMMVHIYIFSELV